MAIYIGVLTTLTHGSKLVCKLRLIRSYTGRKVLTAKTSFLNDLDCDRSILYVRNFVNLRRTRYLCLGVNYMVDYVPRSEGVRAVEAKINVLAGGPAPENRRAIPVFLRRG